jgi:bacillithiol system protein YtxJ
MQFIALENEAQLDEIRNKNGYIVIFKHNTTCPISKAVRAQFEEEAEQLDNVEEVYFLDLLAYRNLSDKIAADYNVRHQSPQLLLINNGQCNYNEALYDISVASTAAACQTDK